MATDQPIENSELFTKATELLNAKDYSKAAGVFSELRKQGETSIALESYLGRALIESGKVSDGLFHLGLANYLSRGNSLVKTNLRYAQARIEGDWGTEISHPAEFFIKVETRIRSEEILFGSLIFLLVFLLALFKPTHFLNKIRTWSLVASLSLVFFALGTVAFNQSMAVSNKVTEVRNLPLVSDAPKAVLPEGARFRIIQIRDGYAEIERPGKLRGWIDRQNATFIVN